MLHTLILSIGSFYVYMFVSLVVVPLFVILFIDLLISMLIQDIRMPLSALKYFRYFLLLIPTFLSYLSIPKCAMRMEAVLPPSGGKRLY